MSELTMHAKRIFLQGSEAIQGLGFNNECQTVIGDDTTEVFTVAILDEMGNFKDVDAQRYSYNLHIGLGDESDVVSQMCDTPHCVNFLHLTAMPLAAHRILKRRREREQPKVKKFGTVTFDKSRNKWQAQASFNGKQQTVGRFESKEAAQAALDAKRKELGK